MIGVLLCPTFVEAMEFESNLKPTSVIEIKTTPQQKYMTSHEAYELLLHKPDIVFVDVRDPVEISLYGHPVFLDAIVPVRAQSTEFDETIKQWRLKDNPDFIAEMDEVLSREGMSKEDMIILTCGSGMRSALAAIKLYDAGFTNVWHIPDGYPGDDKPGFNVANAWKLAGLPWSYEHVYGADNLRIIK